MPEEKQHQRPVFLKHVEPVDEALRKLAIRKMADLLERGGRVVIGVNESVDEGRTVARDGQRHLVIKRRATRDEFLDAAPLGRPEDLAVVSEIRAPFYYELELWDQVLEGPDGERFGIRIREQRKGAAS
jgi:hypothetical protein